MSENQVHVRGYLQYPYLFAPRDPSQSRFANSNSKPKYEATVILDAAEAGKAWQVVEQVAKAAYGTVPPQDRLPLRSGTTKAHKAGAGFTAENWFIAAKSDRPPFLCTTERQVEGLHDPDARSFYAGAYVDVLVDIWAESRPQYGQRVSAEVLGVQFLQHGPPLQAGSAGQAPVTGSSFGLPTTGGRDPAGVPQAPQQPYQQPPQAPQQPAQYGPTQAPQQPPQAPQQPPQAPQQPAPPPGLKAPQQPAQYGPTQAPQQPAQYGPPPAPPRPLPN